MKRAISDRAKPCSVCAKLTKLRCGDCLQAWDKGVPICQRASCQEEHLLACAVGECG